MLSKSGLVDCDFQINNSQKRIAVSKYLRLRLWGLRYSPSSDVKRRIRHL